MSTMPPAPSLRSRPPPPSSPAPPTSSRSMRSRIWRLAVDGVGRELRDLLAERAIAGDRAQLDQRLALPQPRVLGVVAPPAGERGHQQALRARRAQPRVDLVEPAARCALAQRAEQALGAAREPF